MLVVLSDTHATDDHRLAGPVLAAVRDADLVLHAGDFTTEAALDAFREEARDLRAVHGNRDDPAVAERLPAATSLRYAGVDVAMTHTRRGGETGLAMFGRERGAALVVFGHSHRPLARETEGLTLLNPGSHAQPRGNRQAFAVLEPADRGLSGELRTVDGAAFESFRVEAGNGAD